MSIMNSQLSLSRIGANAMIHVKSLQSEINQRKSKLDDLFDSNVFRCLRSNARQSKSFFLSLDCQRVGMMFK